MAGIGGHPEHGRIGGLLGCFAQAQGQEESERCYGTELGLFDSNCHIFCAEGPSLREYGHLIRLGRRLGRYGT